MSLALWFARPDRADRFKMVHNQDLRILVGSTSGQAMLNFPIFSGFGQLGRHILSLWKQAQSAFFQQRMCKREQLGQRRQGPRGHNVDGFGCLVYKLFDPRRVDDDGRAGGLPGLAQERGLLANALDQVDLRTFGVGKRAGNDDPRKSGARSEVGPHSSVGSQIQELERVGDMPRPDHRDGRAGDQICVFLPIDQELDKAIKPSRCFT